MSKYLISALLLVGLGTLKIGVTGGAMSHEALGEPLAYESALLNQSPLPEENGQSPVREFARAVITAYSSQVEETDDTPFITASGTKVRPGVVAANWLPLGAKIRIPDIFGERVFVVEDRMHARYSNERVDIWVPSTDEALRFGSVSARIEIL